MSRWERIKRAATECNQRIDDALQGEGPSPVTAARVAKAVVTFVGKLLWHLFLWLLEATGQSIRRWWLVALVALTAAGVALSGGWWLTDKVLTDDPCGQAHELRVVTTPDTQLVLQAQAAGFVAEQQRLGCAVTVSVSSVDSFDDLSSKGFAGEYGAWQPVSQQNPAILGPHPDIVIPALSAQAESLQSIASEDFLLQNEGSLATSKVVLAVPFAYDLVEADLPALLSEASDARLRVARPDPERSEAALVFTRTLYQLDGKRPLPVGERRRLEADLSPADVPLDSAAAPFCRLDNTDVGIVLPAHVFHTFDSGAIPSSLCAGSRLTTVSYKQVRITGLPALDYPFLRVRWPGQSDRERDELIDRFRDWLGAHLPSAGFGPPAKARSGLTKAQYQETSSAHRQARREIKVLFLLDNSGSMRRAVADGRSLDRGGRLISRIVDRLGGSDWAALWALPGNDKEGATQRVQGGPVDVEQSRRIKNAVAELELTTGNYSPVYAGLVHAVRQLDRPGDLTVILVTDGENRVPGRQPVDDITFDTAVNEVVESGARLEVLAVSPSECALEDLAKLDRRPDPELTAHCLPAAYDDVDTLVSQVVGRLRAGA